MDEALGALAAEAAVRRLVTHYADIVNRRAWAELGDVFVAGAAVTLDLRDGNPRELSAPGQFGEMVSVAVERFAFFQFVPLTHRIHLDHGDDDAARGRLWMSEIRRDHEGCWTRVYGVYHDHYRRHEGRWCFARRWYHTLAREGDGVDAVFAFPAEGELPRL